MKGFKLLALMLMLATSPFILVASLIGLVYGSIEQGFNTGRKLGLGIW